MKGGKFVSLAERGGLIGDVIKEIEEIIKGIEQKKNEINESGEYIYETGKEDGLRAAIRVIERYIK